LAFFVAEAQAVNPAFRFTNPSGAALLYVTFLTNDDCPSKDDLKI
jgi:hypothetical protein